MPDFDWKGDSAVVAAVLAGLGLLRRILAPYAIRQMTEAVEPKFQELNGKVDRVMQELEDARDARLEIGERLSKVEGIIDRRSRPR